MRKFLMISAFVLASANVGAGFAASDYGPKPAQKGQVLGATKFADAIIVNCGIVSFNAIPAVVSAGQKSLLSWNTQGCDSVVIKNNSTGNVAPVDASGSIATVPLSSTTTYTLSATGPNSQTSPVIDFTVKVGDAISSPDCNINSFSVDPATVTSGDSATISWSTSGCSNISIKNLNTGRSVGADSVGSAPTISLDSDTSYAIFASSASRSLSKTLTVKIGSASSGNGLVGVSGDNCEITKFDAAKTLVISGGSTNLGWTSNNCVSVTLQEDPDGKYASETKVDPSSSADTGTLNKTEYFTLRAVGSSGQLKYRALTITVVPSLSNN